MRHPKLSTTAVIEMGAMMPPRDTPIEPMARAHPRFTTNHLVTVALSTGPPYRLGPRARLMAWNRKKKMKAF